MSDEGIEWAPALQGLPKGYGRVAPNDPRIPAPAPDPVIIDPETHVPIVGLVLPAFVASAKKAVEEDMPAKIGIYATGSEFAVAVLDEGNDPVDGGSFKFDSLTILNKIKPLLEAGGHKVVDYTMGSLVASTTSNVTAMRRSRKVASGE